MQNDPYARQRRSRRRRRRRRPPALLIIVLVGLAALTAAFLAARARETSPSPRGPYLIGAWTFGDTASLERALNAGALDEVSCDWLQSRADGGVIAPRLVPGFAANARDAGCRAFVTLTDYDQTSQRFDPAIAAAILSSATSRESHARTVVAWVRANHFDGVDVDWEAVKAGQRDEYSAFVRTLARHAHAEDLLVGVDVYPKTSEPGGWDGPRSQDWKQLGEAVDQFRIMTYNYSGSWSGPGPLSPPLWMDRVLTFAEAHVEPRKIVMGVGLYGRAWREGQTTDLLWRDMQRIISEEAPRRSRGASSELTLHYTRDGATHIAFFPDERAMRAKLAMLLERHPEIGGIYCWLMGQEDPAVWPLIAARLR